MKGKPGVEASNCLFWTELRCRKRFNSCVSFHTPLPLRNIQISCMRMFIGTKQVHQAASVWKDRQWQRCPAQPPLQRVLGPQQTQLRVNCFNCRWLEAQTSEGENNARPTFDGTDRVGFPKCWSLGKLNWARWIWKWDTSSSGNQRGLSVTVFMSGSSMQKSMKGDYDR